jgi:hypothetical protein
MYLSSPRSILVLMFMFASEVADPDRIQRAGLKSGREAGLEWMAMEWSLRAKTED